MPGRKDLKVKSLKQGNRGGSVEFWKKCFKVRQFARNGSGGQDEVDYCLPDKRRVQYAI